MRRALLALLLLSGVARADEELFSSVYWPRSVPLKLTPARARLTGPLPGKLGTHNKGDPFPPGAPRPGGERTPVPSAVTPDAAAAPETARRQAAAAKAMDREMGEVNRQLIEFGTSARDLVRITLSRDRRTLLRPLLLFLAERGVLEPGEVDAWMSAEDVEPLLDKVRQAVARLEDRRDALEVRRYLLEKK